MFSSYTFLQTMQNSFDSLVPSIVAQSVAHVFMSLLNICKQSPSVLTESLRQVPIRHSQGGASAEIKVRFLPSTMCRLTQIFHEKLY